MGGKAFSHVGVHVARMDTQLYQKVCSYLSAGARSQQITVDVPQHIEEKDSHGDIDICVQTDDFSNLDSWLNSLNIEHKHRNGPVLSIAIRLPYIDLADHLYQVDLIKTQPQWHNFAVQYFSYNDAGNLYGRIAHRLGFKLGFDGLFYVLRSEHHVIAELLVTSGWDTALKLLAIDPQPQANGFKTYEQLFKAVTRCPWFNSQIFLLENRNHVSRVRDAKRKTYNMFLDWLKQTEFQPYSFDWTDENKQQIRERILTEVRYRFPEFNKQYNEALTKAHRSKQLRQLVNGEILGQLSGKQGKELGALVSEIKGLFPDQMSYESFVLSVGTNAPHVLYECWKVSKRYISTTP